MINNYFTDEIISLEKILESRIYLYKHTVNCVFTFVEKLSLKVEFILYLTFLKKKKNAFNEWKTSLN